MISSALADFSKYQCCFFPEIWNYPGGFDWADEIQTETEGDPDTGGYYKTERGESLEKWHVTFFLHPSLPSYQLKFLLDRLKMI